MRRRLQGVAPARFPLPYRGMGEFAPSQLPAGFDEHWRFSSGGITFPLPRGASTVGVTISPGSIIPAGTVDRIKSWMTESTIVTGYPNWQVAGGAVLAYMLLRKK